jgi:hypothetical protein
MSSHRLHDFVELGKTIFAAIGEEPDRFVKMMDDMRRTTGSEIAAGDTFITATRTLLAKLLKGAPKGRALPGWNSWFSKDCAAVLIEDGSAVVGIRGRYIVANLKAPLTNGIDWMPKNDRDLNGALLRTMPIFADIGIEVVKREPSKGHPYWEFCLTKPAIALGEKQ